MRLTRPLLAALLLTPALACERFKSSQTADQGADSTKAVAAAPVLPPDADHAVSVLNASPRHGQFVMIPNGTGDSLRAWIVYPARSTKAPVVVVVHEIFGMSDWIRAAADRIAAEGYIAIVPDLLSKQKLPGAPDSVSMQAGMAAVSKLNPNEVLREIKETATYATGLPSALPKYGVVGFCWGGGVAFNFAAHSPDVSAVVVYYGESPKLELLSKVSAPVLGLYGQNDERVVADVPPTDSAMQTMKKTYTYHIYDGAEHGFMRMQNGTADGSNLKASQQAWPATISWLHKYLGT
ncbi:MAG TPA: dienelactone hydrolase family protein [Gemmatimonadaceae bacterium]|jgi:carboxymethylenebutenolidase|nr:dienelactone hydrolase family protein [Gemmatimonadaceae bacterium]